MSVPQLILIRVNIIIYLSISISLVRNPYISFQASMNVVCVVLSVCNAHVPSIHLHIFASSTFLSFGLIPLLLSLTFPIFICSFSLFNIEPLFFNPVLLLALLQFLLFYNVHVDQD